MKYRLPPVNAQPMVSLGPDAVLVADGWAGKSVADVQTDEERFLLGLVDGKRTVADILRVSRYSGFVTMRQLRSLSERRIIRTVPKVNDPSFGRTTARLGPPRMGMTQDLSAVAQVLAAPANETPTPQPVLTVPARQPARRLTPALPPVGAAQTAALAPARVTPAALPPVRATIEVAPSAARSSTALVPTIVRAIARPVTAPPQLGEMAAQAVELWFSLAKRQWSTLVVVPGHKLGSAVPLACALAEAGSAILRRPIELYSAEGRDLIPTTDWIFPREPGDKYRRVIALEPVSANPMGIPVAQAAQAVLIAVDRGQSDLTTVRRTVEAIGRERVTGCVLVSPPKPIKLR